MEFILIRIAASAITGLFCGWGCVVIAKGKGFPESKNGMWFAIGFFFSFFGLIAAALSKTRPRL